MRDYPSGMEHAAMHRVTSIGGWFAVGALLGIGVLGILTVGVPLLAFGVLIGVVLVTNGHRGTCWAAPIGVGVALVVLGLLQTPSRACNTSPQTLAPGQHSIECGGLDPGPYAVLGALLILGALLAVAVSRRLDRSAPSS